MNLMNLSNGNLAALCALVSLAVFVGTGLALLIFSSAFAERGETGGTNKTSPIARRPEPTLAPPPKHRIDVTA